MIPLPDETLEPAAGQRAFEVVGHRMVRIDVDDEVWIKRGSVVAYHGDLRFRRDRVMQRDARPLNHEAVPLAVVTGRGLLYVSNDGQYSRVVRLERETMYVVSSNLLAFERALEHEIIMVGGVGVLAGGLFVVKLSGTGFVAFSANGDPLTMRVHPGDPISTDPTAIVAWTARLWPELKTDLEMRSLLAHGGGEPIQMRFSGDGDVVVNARTRSEAIRASVFKQVISKIKRLFP